MVFEIMHRKAGSNNISARFSSTKLMLINGAQLTVDGAVTFSSALRVQQITGLADPQVTHAATKAYVDLKQVHWTDTGYRRRQWSYSTVATSTTNNKWYTKRNRDRKWTGNYN